MSSFIPGGFRADSSEGEWPVSYHGTKKESVLGIAEKGYLLSMGKKFQYGLGIYSAPSIEVAATYAHHFTWKGMTLRVVFQNRVSPKGLQEINTPFNEEYWLQPDEKLIRPYGLCIRQFSDNFM